MSVSNHPIAAGISEKQVGIASKLYAARKAMRDLWAEEFPKKMEEYQAYLRGRMKKHGEDEITATMNMVADLQANLPDSGMAQALVLAAYVEMVEPSPASQS